MLPDFVAIGHITKDLLPDGSFTTGGTVTFAAITARNFGKQAAIVTVAPPQIQNLSIFNDVQIVGPTSQIATTFENVYTSEGRLQYVSAVAPKITAVAVPTAWRDTKIVLLGPVAQECELDLLDAFPQALIGLTPQGFMRGWDTDTGRVYPLQWAKAAQVLPRIGALILSREDLPTGTQGDELLQQYVAMCPVVACTHGAAGCTVYFAGQSQKVAAYPAQEVDPTGAGDVFAASFLIKLQETTNPLEAARFANAAAACNVEHPGASGVPTLAQVEARLKVL